LSALANRLASVEDVDVAEPIDPTLTQSLEIVLADDNTSNRLLLARILLNAGHQVREASRGDEAYDLMLAATADLAILDLNMPDMTGPDVIKLFRAGEVGGKSRLPILVLSADATPSAREESISAGASEFLTKPVTAQTLLAAIHRLAGGRTSRQEPKRPTPMPSSEHSSDRSAHPCIEESTRSQMPYGSHLSAGTLIDAERLYALRKVANFDQTFLDKYVAAAIDDLEKAVAELRVALPSRNTVLARAALHNIDGTATTVGATAIALSAQRLRQWVSDDRSQAAQQTLAELESNMALTKSALRASILSMGTKHA
jgi:two-component system sensor histidine kinase RpfC